MPQALKATWEVRAGLIPGEPVEEYTKRWNYTSADDAEDAAHAKEIGYQSVFMKTMAIAAMYHLQMSDPRLNNWAQLTFIWY